LIGIIAKESDFEAVDEFFQLFKTPWEFYEDGKEYDVVIINKGKKIDKINAKLLLIFGHECMEFDCNKNILLDANSTIRLLRIDEISLPIYTQISTFKNVSHDNVFLVGDSKVIGLKIQDNSQKVLRIGYNLFEEVSYLLSKGQPIENALIPTLEIHIALLKKWILDTGIPLIEIPPIPAGYDFIICLTHDVDFVNVRDHLFDHSMWGFIYRGLFGPWKKIVKGESSNSHLLQNLKAVLSLPLVYLGAVKDFWFQFDRYLEIEKNLKSTYFFIPFKNRVGERVFCRNAVHRASKYDVRDLEELLKNLVNEGNEIGVHGIDAWHNADSGYQEFKSISEIIGEFNLGIRIHWLLQDNQTFATLEKAGYHWDSSFGYNETVGYRGGTTQVFRPISVKDLLELPLHIQDTTLFYPSRMDLSEKMAMNLCEKLINDASFYGGVLTINWHQRSLAPERLWGDFYLRLLQKLQIKRPWFATASQAVEWFKKRRTVFFDEVQFTGNKVRLSLRSDENDMQPPLLVRIHRPLIDKSRNNDLSIPVRNYFDISWRGEREMEISI
jgi:hypothetical protein